MTPDPSPFCDVDEATMRAMTRSLAVLRSVKADSAIYKIDERVYLGSLGVALNEDLLTNSGISHIICVARGIKPYYANRFTYLTIDLLDSVNESLIDRLPDALAFIHATFAANADSRIFIHCFAGRSRSVAIILAYLMIFHSLSLKSAFHHVRSIRASANPNSHFMHTLKALELEIAATNFRYDPAIDHATFIENLHAVIPGVKTRVRLLQHSTPSPPSAPVLPLKPTVQPDAFISWEAAPVDEPASRKHAVSWWLLTAVTVGITVALSLLLKRLEKFFFPSLVSIN